MELYGQESETNQRCLEGIMFWLKLVEKLNWQQLKSNDLINQIDSSHPLLKKNQFLSFSLIFVFFSIGNFQNMIKVQKSWTIVIFLENYNFTIKQSF